MAPAISSPNCVKTRVPILGLGLLVVALTGCHAGSSAPNRGFVGAQIAHRMGHSIPDGIPPGQVTLPPGAKLDDGLTEDEAVSIALWNNAAFQDLLVDLGIARSDLIQAGLLPNPEMAYFFHVPQKPFKYAFEFPIEALWLRPVRLRIAGREANRAADRLVQSGLDLMRDVRQAFADVLLAQERLRVAKEGVRLRSQIADFADRRLKAGDISAQEAAVAKIDALQAEQDAVRIGYETPIAEERLRNLLGLGPIRCPLTLIAEAPAATRLPNVDALTQEAMATRPDALAAAEAVSAAQARLRFARLGWVRLLGVADATSGQNGHEFGPALRFTIPIFNWNQGGIARAQAELERAIRQQQTVAYQIILDVQRAALQYQQASAEIEILRSKVRPEVETGIRRAQKAYQEGGITYLIVLEATRQLLDNYLREAVLVGDLRRFWAELERSVGRRLPKE